MQPMKNKGLFTIIYICFAILANAQTGGPGQPEFMQFQQADTEGLVNPSTGIFAYQIPLFSIGGYPMNLTYQAGIQMEDVATMVGLGWNLNAGSIVRTLRGLPDDFDGDIVTKEFSVKDNVTYGGKIGADVEIAGFSDVIGVSVGADIGVFFNNYKGWGMEPSLRGSLSAAFQSSEGTGGFASLGMGVTANSQTGVDKHISPNIGFKLGMGNDQAMSVSLGKTWAVNSNEGLKTSINTGLNYTKYAKSNRKYIKNGIRKTDGRDSGSYALSMGSRSYLNNSYQPDIDYPFVNISGSYSGTVGLDVYYVDPAFRLTGYFSKQKLKATSQYFKAYGIMYEDEDKLDGKVLMDFNREKKLPYYIGESKILPVPYTTPDVFNLNAQGLSLSFTVNKNDVGIVGDPVISVTSVGKQLGVEANIGSLFKAGANLGTTYSEQKGGRWTPDNLPFEFNPGQHINGNELYQQIYMKNNAEINAFNHDLFEALWDYRPYFANVIDEQSVELFASTINTTQNKTQPVRQTAINYLTANEASKIGFDKEIIYYTFSNQKKTLKRIDTNEYIRKGHHLSEISVTQPDGMRYVFGIPVYNTKQKEVTFNVSKDNMDVDFDKNLVYYSGTDNSVSNKNGIDHFFSATHTPPYATQFLITAVLSPDYRDITGNGISDDDLGNYVKFSYYKEDFKYNWRTPYEKNMATYNRGLRSDPEDDKGSYVYGEKELWYIRSMESRTEIAFFYYSKREDGLGVLGEDGGKNNANFLRKLDSVKVYSKPDYLANSTAAIPLKTIVFSYDYELCKGINNNKVSDGGKLTLRKVAITHEDSKKGLHTPYTFSYGEQPNGIKVNPDYGVRDVNRWGYYQKNPKNAYSDCEDNSELSNIDFPYASQDRSMMDENAYAWNLTGIEIPGGGKIAVEYEAHDYAYIQNKAPGQMFMVAGINELHKEKLYSDNGNNHYFKILFSLTEPVSDQKDFEAKYIRDIKHNYLYYKFYVELKDNKYEYITGYARVKEVGFENNYGFLVLEPASIDDDKPGNGKCNPILKSAIQFMRINRNELIFSSGTEPTNIESFIKSLPGIYNQLKAQIAADATGINQYCINKNYAQTVDLSKSFIRLYNPSRSKIAGGARAKRVSITDHWADMAGGNHQSRTYTTSYYYTTEEKDPAGNSVIISSGVADYEPMIGGDEISLKYPIFYSDEKKRAPDNDFYVEEPINESLFPAPQIYYSKVTQLTNEVKNPQKKVARTGKVVNEFYTAKDYPVRVWRSVVLEERDKTEYNSFQMPFFASDQQHDFATVSQGYSIVLNNMSGMPKATWVYNEQGDRISGEEMEYFPNNDQITTIDQKGRICHNTRMGLSADYTVDGREAYTTATTNIMAANLNTSMIGVFPIPVVMPLFSEMTEEKQFRSLVINKVIHRNGILKSRTVHSQGASVTTENLAFDRVTGEALLTKTTNEFNDTLFSFNYPAWWMYEGMGPAYRNTRLVVNSGNIGSVQQFLMAGDELRNISNGDRLWVNESGLNEFKKAEKGSDGQLNGNYLVYVSGAKNLLDASAGQAVTWNVNPISNSNTITFPTAAILNSGAMEYYDLAVLYCEECDLISTRYGKNDFLAGLRGNWKPKKSWFHLTDRTGAPIGNSFTDIRTQGLFAQYNDFWKVPDSTNPNWAIDSTNWEWAEKTNLTDANGLIIETEDRIGRKVASLVIHDGTLIGSQTLNAGYNEVFSEGFEDYEYSYCPFKRKHPNLVYVKRLTHIYGTAELVKTHAHTGKYALKVDNSIAFSNEQPRTVRGYDKNNQDDPDQTPVDGPDPVEATSDCIGGFNPEPDKEYIFSCWVKVDKPQPILSNSEATVNISANNMNNVLSTFHAEGPVIEGWQRIKGTFTTPAQIESIIIRLNKGDNHAAFYDDIRIHPADAMMVSYVYDDLRLRHTYSLDENNYFTKYEYNNQGELIRIKKETEKGIITLQESNHSLIKKNQ